MTMNWTPVKSLSALCVGALLAACGGDSDDPPLLPEETRAHDARQFTAVDATATTFAPMATVAGQLDMSTTSRWAGVLNGAAYRVEVPANWNGRLVMYAHGYAGMGADLIVQNPSIRRYFIQNGYAWAASSYSKNYYDVRAGVEDTNALALAFNEIAAARGRPLPSPAKTYITGHSMGGHITAAAIEAETLATARNKKRYDGAVPMCGVMGDTALFDTFAAMQVSAQALAGVPDHPFTGWGEIAGTVTNTLFATFPSQASPTAQITATPGVGEQYLSVLENLTGGDRPMFDQAVRFGGSFPSAYGTFGGDGTINGILNKNVLDTRDFTYTYLDADGNPQPLNVGQVITPEPDANRLRTDGLRWVPKVNGEIGVPVVSIHTLGDLFVPFNMQQIYQKRVADKGNTQWLVQRAIRGASHCDFTIAEQVEAFSDMVAWESGGAKPAGDDVVNPDVVAQPTYGCTFTRNVLGTEESTTTNRLRTALVTQAPCSALN
ncbi:MAG: alpha/beta hydrolase [Hydrogenophaga sp.]|nr:alpha/beta hydrolase [Hydrogenophaga sp.]